VANVRNGHTRIARDDRADPSELPNEIAERESLG
jgi:hypothetical protein